MTQVELLAPAGSPEGMKAAIAAGADAVYMGGSRFGARAYAENPEEEQLLEAIAYAHIHGRKLYLTVNTLLKEEELEQELYDYMLPLYQAGVDAVIVQDMGVLARIRQWFPDLPIHASTQMTLTGPDSAGLLLESGANRIVTPRELSLEEIREIRKNCPSIEIETFVHGALCYCYSGQCLYSSLAGGRSGNRGRCAQPCRMEYRYFEQSRKGRSCNTEEEVYLLSPKDLNTLDILPDLIEAGVNSLKIEGRMKKPVYAAGVTAIYRKYVDRYLTKGKKGYFVEQEDRQRLWDLFNRKGFTEGYLRKHNGRDMITLTKPDFRPGNDSWIISLKSRYIDTKLQEKVKGNVILRQHFPVTMELSCRGITVSCQGDIPVTANKQPATRESILKQMSKFGGTPFSAEQLDVTLEDGLFVSVGGVNALRRQTIECLEKALTDQYVRTLPDTRVLEQMPCKEKSADDALQNPMDVSASVETLEQLDAVLASGGVSRIYLDSLIAEPKQWRQLAEQIQGKGIQAFLMMPRIFRSQAKAYFEKYGAEWKQAGFDGFLVRTIEELEYLKASGEKTMLVADHMLYTYNKAAQDFLFRQGVSEDTVPIELNAAEWKSRGIKRSEVLLYGRLPMMVSAQCLKKTTGKCNHKQEVTYLQDRTKVRMPVKSVCPYCYNIIYNGYVLSLLEEWRTISAMSPKSVRFSFTIETAEETSTVLKGWKCALKGCMVQMPDMPLTKGHFRRGVQ